MKEWDIASVKRKFEYSYVYCSVGNGSPSWQWVDKVNDAGFCSVNGRKAWAQTETQEVEANPDIPRVKFFYRPINLGWCYSECGPVLLLRNQEKSFKVGISTETHYFGYRDEDFTDVHPNPDLDSQESAIYTVFNRFLWKKENSLLFMNDEIGFMEGTKCFLNRPSFTNLVKKTLGNKWQVLC